LREITIHSATLSFKPFPVNMMYSITVMHKESIASDQEFIHRYNKR